MKRSLAALLLAASLAACAFFTAPVEAPSDTTVVATLENGTRVVNRRPAAIHYLHQGIWWDVVWCLGIDPEDAVQPGDISWSVADSIQTAEGFLAYGMTVIDSLDRPIGIIIETPYYFVPAVISHEIIHVQTGPVSNSHPAELFVACTMPLPFDMPLRNWK